MYVCKPDKDGPLKSSKTEALVFLNTHSHADETITKKKEEEEEIS